MTAAVDEPPVFDLTGWTRVAATGADAAAFLHRFCTADVLTHLKAGRGCEAFFTSEKARVLAHGWVVPGEAAGSVEIVGTPGQADTLIPHLSKYALMEDVTFADRTGDPLSYACPPRADGPPSGDLLEGGRFAFEVPPGAVPLSEEARVAAKLPRHGVDLTPDHLAMEADRPWAICYTKGCYLGQEPVARVRALGRVNRLLRGFRLDPGSPSPGSPSPLGGAPVTADGVEVGVATSVAGGAALGMVKRKWAEPGTAVRVGDADAVVF